MTAKRGRRPLVFLVRGTVGVAVLAYLFSQLQGGEVAAALRSLDAPLWIAAVALYLVGQAVCAWKWGLLACALGMRRPYHSLLAFYCGGMFANLFLPTTVGGDIGRAAAIAPPDGTLGRGVISVLGDRGTGFIALLLLAGAGVLMEPGLPAWIRLGTLGGAVLALAGSAMALAAPELFRRLGKPLHGAILACRPPALWVPVAVVSLLFQVLTVVVHILLGRALGLEIPLGTYVLASTLVAIVAMAPISINGLGTRDAAYVYFLGLAQVPQESGLAFALSWLALILVSGAIGGLVFSLLAPGQMTFFTRRAPAEGEEGR
ncbi:MAG TPA: flippase-like domain-containing protein [Armatimonadetes bacterium]|nr:flippase-like domain-containing protein [Armatimonadota bacterium]